VTACGSSRARCAGAAAAAATAHTRTSNRDLALRIYSFSVRSGPVPAPTTSSVHTLARAPASHPRQRGPALQSATRHTERHTHRERARHTRWTRGRGAQGRRRP
jgi:hypothetical protein